MADELLYKFLDADDSVPLPKLKLSEQLRLLVRHLTYDAAKELEAEDLVTTEYLSRKADLLEFINKATESIKKGKHKNVTLSISSKFSDVLDDVIKSPQIQNYFIVSVARPRIEYDIPTDILLRIEIRQE